MIDVCAWMTLNGRKVPALAEEPGVEHKDLLIDITTGEPFDPAFLRIEPSDRNTAIVHQNNDIHRQGRCRHAVQGQQV